MLPRPLVLAVLTTAAVSVACSSSGSSGTSSSPGSSPSSSSSAGSIGAKVQAGLADLSSAHLQVNGGTMLGSFTGDVAFSGGKATASHLLVDPGASQTEVITVGTTTYAKLPAGQTTTGKPWTTVTATSNNEFVRALAGKLALTQVATSVGELSTLLTSAVRSSKDDGAATVHGVSAEHYTLTIDPTKATGQLGTALSLAGSTPLPVELWLDAQNRPVQVRLTLPLGGQRLPILIEVSKYNAPVHITAPPADQVSSG